MRYVWDEPKRVSNLADHGLDFADAGARFEWSEAVIVPNYSGSRGESRFIAIGFLDDDRHAGVLAARQRGVVFHQPATGERKGKGSSMTRAKRRAPEIGDEQESRIQAGIRADPDNPELTEEDFAKALPASRFFTPKQLAAMSGGRPLPRGVARRPTKLPIKLRLDADVVEAFKADGEGWQTRMNDALRRSVRRKLAV